MKKYLILSLVILFAVKISVNAATIDDVKVCKDSYVLVCDDWTANGQVRPGKGSLFGNGYFLDVTGGSVTTTKGTSDPVEILGNGLHRYGERFAKKYKEYAGTHHNCLRLKNAQDVIAMKVVANSKIIFLMQGNYATGTTASIPKIATDEKLLNVLNAAPIESNNSVAACCKYEWTAPDDMTIYIGSYNGDIYISMIIVEVNTRYWDFTKWSDETIANLKADAALGTDTGWSDDEKNDGANMDATAGNCFWAVTTPNENGELLANGEVIEELKGLVFGENVNNRGMAIAVNYPETSLGTYHGPSYLWLGGSNKKYFTIPSVKGGATIKMGVESHKTSDARGIQFLVDDWKFGDAFTPTVYAENTWTVPEGETVDIVVDNTNGCHIYYIEVEESVILPPPVITYNGRKVRLSSDEDGMIFYYTLDGTSPIDGLGKSDSVIQYEGEFSVNNLCQLRAIGVNGSQNISDEVIYNIDYLYDGKTAYVGQDNLLEKAFEWCGGLGAVERLTVEGPLSDADLTLLKNAPVMAHLDLGKTRLTSGRMPDGAFSGTGLVSFVSPYGFGSMGEQVFANCPRLAAVVWNASTGLPVNALAGVSNPNLLLYVRYAAYAPPTVTNVVVDGVAERIVLTDKDTGNNDFYCPQAFTATTVSYAHDFRMQTGIGVCRGWESIALPFTVQTITHERNGQLQPFMADGDGKPFWLLQMSPTGLEPATEIKANQPYVIAMPNNEVYPDAYNQAGRVTFAARQAAIVPSELSGVEGLGVVLVPALRRVPQSADVFAINRNVPYESYAEGSIFVSDYREVRPFEAYTLHPAGGSRLIALSDLMSDSATGLVAIPIEEAADGTVSVYSLSGLLVATGERSEVMKRLPKGVYIINGKKMVIR